MNPNISVRFLFRLLFATLLLSFTSSVSGQNTINEKLFPSFNPQKPLIQWSDSLRLTWNDFIAQDGKEPFSFYNVQLLRQRVSRTHVIKNTIYTWSEYVNAINPNNSFYNPETVTEWELRYYNLLFDIAELSVRLTLNPPQNKTDHDLDQARKYFTASVEALETESGYGKDTTVIEAYEKEVRELLEKNPRKEFSTDLFNTDYKSGIALYFGYSHNSIIGKNSGTFQSFNGFDIGIESLIRKTKINFNIDFLWSRTLKPNLYYDETIDYEWKQDRKTMKMGPSIKVGYQVFSNDRIVLYPVAGIGITNYSQDCKDKEDKEKTSYIISSPCWTIGLDADWTLARSIKIQEMSYTNLRFKFYGTFEKNRVIGDIWSLNIGLLYIIGGSY